MPQLRRSPIWSDPRVKPPYGGVFLDQAHPLAPDMCWLYNEGAGLALFDPAGQARATITEPANVRRTPTLGGIGLSATAGTDAAGITIANGLTLTGAAGWSWDARCSPTSACENYGLLCNNAASNMGVFFRGSVLKLVVYIGADNVATTAITSATRHHFGVSMVSAGAGTQYLDGTGNGSILGIGIDWVPLYQLNFPGATASFDGTVDYQRFWRRPLTAGDMGWLAAEPYIMFRPIIRRRYFLAAAAGGGDGDGILYRRMARSRLLPLPLATPITY